MTRPLVSRTAALLRRLLGQEQALGRMAGLEDRLAGLEGRLAGLEGPRYPSGPVYLGDHQALVAARWGGKLVVDTRDSLLAPWLLLDGLWESHMTGWLHDVLRPGDTFVDVGANIGYYSVLAGLRVGSAGRVVAVEAHPGLARLLRRNVTINGLHTRTEVWQRAAWSGPADLPFHQRLHYSANSSVGPVAPETLEQLADEEEVVQVQGVAVDTLLGALGRVDVLKVDVEGAEVHAFTGLAGTIAAHTGISIMFEWSPEQLIQVGSRPGELVDLLEGMGLGFCLLENGLQPIERARLLSLSYGNVLARRSGA